MKSSTQGVFFPFIYMYIVFKLIASNWKQCNPGYKWMNGRWLGAEKDFVLIIQFNATLGCYYKIHKMRRICLKSQKKQSLDKSYNMLFNS